MATILAGEETLVNTVTNGIQDNQKVAALANGGWVVTWRSSGQDAPGDGVYSQAYDAAGVPIGAETQVNTFTTGNQNGQQVTALEGGGWVVTWQSANQDGSGDGVYQQAFSDTGAPVGIETRVNTFTTNDQVAPQITALTGGGWVVTWRSAAQDGDGAGVYQQAYSAAGAMAGVETRVNTTTAGSQTAQQIAALEGGGWVVTWVSPDADGNGIYQQAYNAAGLAVGAEARVNTFTTGNQFVPQVTALNGGGWVATWQSAGQDGNGAGVYQQAYTADGVKAGGETQVNLFTIGDQGNPQIAALANGDWVVTWSSVGQDGSGPGVYSQAFAADGNRIGTETQVNTFTAGVQTGQQVTALEGGGWVITWRSLDQDGDGWGVYQQAYHADGTAAGVEMQVNSFTTDNQDNPEITALNDGGWVVTWQSNGQDGNSRGVYQKVFHFNQAPVITSNGSGPTAAVNMAENGTFVTTVTSSDPNGQPGSYSIVGGADAGKFQIDASTGALSFRKAPDFEAPTDAGGNNVYNVVVRVSDGELFDTQSIAVRVLDAVDFLIGTANNNRLTGAKGVDDIRGLDGNDVLAGKAGNDRLFGGNGNDTLVGGAGSDHLDGGRGVDIASYRDAARKVVANLADPTRNTGDAKGDSYRSIEGLEGSKFADMLTGNHKSNVLTGGSGDDVLVGGLGGDILTGGKNSDSFVFKSVEDSPSKKNGWDIITDFSRKQHDVIDLKAIDAMTGKGNQAFIFIGDDAFSGTKGELRYEKQSTKTFVYGDVDGDGQADLRIELSKAINLKETDFLL